jgi:predicted metal-binding membrane protein
MAALLGVALAWGYSFGRRADERCRRRGHARHARHGHVAMDMSAMAPVAALTLVHFLFVLMMWTVMMIGMIAP